MYVLIYIYIVLSVAYVCIYVCIYIYTFKPCWGSIYVGLSRHRLGKLPPNNSRYTRCVRIKVGALPKITAPNVKPKWQGSDCEDTHKIDPNFWKQPHRSYKDEL